MENSPPGIHAMPSGALSGAGVVFGMVGMKFVVGGKGAGVAAATIELAFGEGVATVFHAAMPTNNTMMPTIRSRGARVAGAACAALMTVLFFLTCYAFSRSKRNALRELALSSQTFRACAHHGELHSSGFVIKSLNLQNLPPLYVTQYRTSHPDVTLVDSLIFIN